MERHTGTDNSVKYHRNQKILNVTTTRRMWSFNVPSTLKSIVSQPKDLAYTNNLPRDTNGTVIVQQPQHHHNHHHVHDQLHLKKKQKQKQFL